MFHTNRSRLSIGLSLIALVLGATNLTACVAAELQPGVYACNDDTDCPPGGFFCDNYFNKYVNAADVNARPIAFNHWGSCLPKDNWVTNVDNGKRVEGCENGIDDDEDSLTDCLDPECHTAPICQEKILSCYVGTPLQDCPNRLGFPLIRDTENLIADKLTCPKSVGVKKDDLPEAVFVGSDINNLDQVCLPRCRLHFPLKDDSPAENAPEIFEGSDNYCNTIVHEGLMTVEHFEQPRTCQHLEMESIGSSSNPIRFQNDVCLPASNIDNCDTCVGRCLVVNFKDRRYLKVTTENKSDLSFTEGQDAESIKRTNYYCL